MRDLKIESVRFTEEIEQRLVIFETKTNETIEIITKIMQLAKINLPKINEKLEDAILLQLKTQKKVKELFPSSSIDNEEFKSLQNVPITLETVYSSAVPRLVLSEIRDGIRTTPNLILRRD